MQYGHPRAQRYCHALSTPRLMVHQRALGGENRSPAAPPPRSRPPRDARARAGPRCHIHSLFASYSGSCPSTEEGLGPFTKHNVEDLASARLLGDRGRVEHERRAKRQGAHCERGERDAERQRVCLAPIICAWRSCALLHRQGRNIRRSKCRCGGGLCHWHQMGCA